MDNFVSISTIGAYKYSIVSYQVEFPYKEFSNAEIETSNGEI